MWQEQLEAQRRHAEIQIQADQQLGWQSRGRHNSARTGLAITDNTYIPVEKDVAGNVTDNDNLDTFHVELANGSKAAVQLGILNSDATEEAKLDGVLEGSQIYGVSLSDRFFIENARVYADIKLSTPENPLARDGDASEDDGINASAKFGFVGINVHGTGSLKPTSRRGSRIRASRDERCRWKNHSPGNVQNDISTIFETPTFSGNGILTLRRRSIRPSIIC